MYVQYKKIQEMKFKQHQSQNKHTIKTAIYDDKN